MKKEKEESVIYREESSSNPGTSSRHSRAFYTIPLGPKDENTSNSTIRNDHFSTAATPDSISTRDSKCPLGLEPLIPLSMIIVREKVESFETFDGWERQNQYEVVDDRGTKLYHIVEKSSSCQRWCCGNLRSCEFHVFDTQRREVLRLDRPFNCTCCLSCCCLQKLEVYSGRALVGSIHQNWNLFRHSFTIRDELGKGVCWLKGPLFRCAGDVPLQIISLSDKRRIGSISKELNEETSHKFMNTDRFKSIVLTDLDAKMKAIVFSTSILIDFMFFERRKKCALF